MCPSQHAGPGHRGPDLDLLVIVACLFVSALATGLVLLAVTLPGR
jgi:hypothetical protein